MVSARIPIAVINLKTASVSRTDDEAIKIDYVLKERRNSNPIQFKMGQGQIIEKWLDAFRPIKSKKDEMLSVMSNLMGEAGMGGKEGASRRRSASFSVATRMATVTESAEDFN